jgi:hypothetical protein
MSDAQYKETLNSNKQIIFKILKALKINKVTVDYSGYGDSGQIDSVSFFRSSKKGVDINKLTNGLIISGLKKCNLGYGTVNGSFSYTRSYEDYPVTSDIESVIKDMCYDLLEEHHGGWEINSGSSGEFVFSVPETSINWQHHDVIESTETTEHNI